MRGWGVEEWEQHGAAPCTSAPRGPRDEARHISLVRHLLSQTTACTFLRDAHVEWRVLWEGEKQRKRLLEADEVPAKGHSDTRRGQSSATVPAYSTYAGQLCEDRREVANTPSPQRASSIGPFIQPSIRLLILLTLHHSHASFFSSVSVSFLRWFLGISHKQRERLGMTHRFLGK